MKKTITVNLSGIVFTLDDDAYETLSAYLDAIKKHFSDAKGGDEVIKDIESSIAEKFSEKITEAKQVINKQDVLDLIKVMGTIDDIIQEDAANGQEDTKQDKAKVKSDYRTGKRLFRNPDDVVFAGVCSGLAAFFGVDSVIVRLLFAISIFFGGAGAILYIILWIVMPMAKSSSQKLEMRGEAVTLEKIEEVAKAKSEKLKNINTSGVKKAISLPFKFIGELFRGLGKAVGKLGWVLGAIIGICLIVSMILAITTLGFAGAALVFNSDSSYIATDVPIQEIISGPLMYIGVVSTLLVAAIPLFFILLLGATLVSRKSAFNAATNSVLIGIWMIAVITLGVVAIDAAPKIEAQVDKYSEINTIEREFTQKDFDKIETQGAHTLRIVPGDEYRIMARGREKDIDRLDLSVKDGRLKIENKVNTRICLFCLYRGVEFDIVMPELDELALSGASDVQAEGFGGDSIRLEISGATSGDLDINYDEIFTRLSGASELELNASTTNIAIDMSGASKMYLEGEGENLEAEISGASSLLADDYVTKYADIDISSASKVEIEVLDEIKGEASGASKIYYIGDPRVDVEVSGGAKVDNR